MTDWETFQRNMLGEAQVVIGRDIEKHKEELGDVSWNHLFDTGGPTKLQQKGRKDDVHFRKIFYGFIEIDASVRTLRDIEIYVSSFPYRNKNITKPRHLRYHVENYFNEIYILKERLNAYLTTVGRCFKGDNRQASILSETRLMFQVVKRVLEGVVNTRGRHVHQSRFDHKDLDRLETMQLLVSNGTKELAWFYDSEYKKIRKEWKKTIKNNNDQTMELLNIYAKALNNVLFSKRNRLKYPRSRKAPNR